MELSFLSLWMTLNLLWKWESQVVTDSYQDQQMGFCRRMIKYEADNPAMDGLTIIVVCLSILLTIRRRRVPWLPCTILRWRQTHFSFEGGLFDCFQSVFIEFINSLYIPEEPLASRFQRMIKGFIIQWIELKTSRITYFPIRMTTSYFLQWF